jgi:hypothetical protein
MCGEDYCETCHPDDNMVAWTEGKHHRRPTFGDYNQRRVAMWRRQETFDGLYLTKRAAAREFPEYLRMQPHAVNVFATLAQPHYDRFVAALPDFARFVGNYVSDACRKPDGRRRKRRERAQQRARILHYLLNDGATAAMRQMHEILRRPIPSWIALEEPVPLPMAA